MTIDFHCHVFSPRVKQERGAYVAVDPVFAQLYSKPGARLLTAEELIASMDEAGVERSVIMGIGWTTAELCRQSNDYLLEATAKYPERLVAFGAVPPGNLDASLAEAERLVGGGAHGVGELRAEAQSFDLEDPLLEALWEHLTEHGFILLLHASEPVGHRYPGKGDLTPQLLMPFIERHPRLTLVLAHWGGGLPFYALMPEVRKALANVYFDSAASAKLYDSRIYRQTAEMAGAEKVLFGSDFPLVDQARAISDVTSLQLPEKMERQIMHDNAASLLEQRVWP